MVSFIDFLKLSTLKEKAIAGGITLVVIASLGTALYFTIKNYGKVECENDVLKTNVTQLQESSVKDAEQDARYNDAADKLNTQLENHKEVVKIINTKTEKEIEKPVYSSTVIPASSLQLLADNATTLNSKRVSD